jgi:hypothetical protein
MRRSPLAGVPVKRYETPEMQYRHTLPEPSPVSGHAT